MNCKTDKLRNGLRVLTTSIPSSESATVTVWVGVGSRQEEDKIAGLSHFIEHIVFKGSKKRPSAKIIAQEVDAIGGEFNAATCKHWTNFYIKARSANLEKMFDILSDMVLNPVLKEEEIEREKGVILEEIKLYEDMPPRHVWDLFEEVAFRGNTLARDTIGTRETVKNLKKDDFIRYRKLHYYPENMVVTVSGGVKEKEVLKLTQKYFGDLKKGNKKEEIALFNSLQTQPQLLLSTKKSEQAHLILGFLGLPLDHKERYALGVLSTLLGGGMSSRLFTEVRERRGLAYSVKTVVDHFVDTGEIMTYAGVDLKKVDEAIKVILDEHYKLASGKKEISIKELSKAKEYLKGHLSLEMEDSRSINEFFGAKEVLIGKKDSLEEVFAGIDKVTQEDVVSLAKKLFVPQGLNLAMIGPFEDEERFKKLLH